MNSKLAIIDEYHQHKPKKLKAPLCPDCKKACKPAGGRLFSSIENTWKCFECDYVVEDIYYLNINLNGTQQ
jgi:hypothetical protein